MSAPQRKQFLVIFSIVLMNSIGFGIIIPVMPQLIMEVTGDGLAEAALWGGLLSLAYALMQFFCAPVLGNLADRFGRRRVLLLTIFGFAIDYAVMGLAPTLGWLLAGRIIAGVAASTNAIANAYVTDISTPEERAGRFGMLGAAFGIGFILGPVIGGLLGEFGTRAPFFAASALGFVNLVVAFFVLKESLPETSRRPFEWRRAQPLGAFRQIATVPTLVSLLVAVFVYNLGHFSLPATWSFYTIERFDWSSREIGMSLAFIGVLMVIVQAGLTPRVVPWLGAPRAAMIGMVFGIVGYVGYALSPVGWLMYVAMVPGALSGFTMPALQALMTSEVAADRQGELQGAIASVNSLTAVVGPPLMTVLFGAFVHESSPVYLPGAAFLVAAVLTMLGLIVLVRHFNTVVAHEGET